MRKKITLVGALCTFLLFSQAGCGKTDDKEMVSAAGPKTAPVAIAASAVPEKKRSGSSRRDEVDRLPANLVGKQSFSTNPNAVGRPK